MRSFILLCLLLHAFSCSAQINLRKDLIAKERRLPLSCGSAPKIVSPVIVGGKVAQLGEFPWMALIGYRAQGKSLFTGWQCGGSLITNRYVLTAAHCINPKEILVTSFTGERTQYEVDKVRLGEHDVSSDTEGAAPYDYEVQQIIVHEQRDTYKLLNDIGMIVLARTVVFTEFVRPICLPPYDLRWQTFVGQWPVVAGWGRMSYGEATKSPTLLKVRVRVSDEDECRRNMTSLNVWGARTEVTIDKTVLCAGAKGRDSCKADSGGPLMYFHLSENDYLGRMYQIGIVSYGYKCAVDGYPGIYTRVSEFMNWILDHLDI